MVDLIYGDIYSSLAMYGMGALVVGAVAAAVSGIYRIIRRNAPRCLYAATFAGYIYILVCITLLSRHIGQYGNVSLSLFEFPAILKHFYIVHYAENFIMLFPLGLLLPIGVKIFRYAGTGLLIGFVVSFIIEITQYVTTLGTFAVDDLIMNGLGCAAGWVIWKAFHIKSRKKKNKSNKCL